jgi:hypothetical protein
MMAREPDQRYASCRDLLRTVGADHRCEQPRRSDADGVAVFPGSSIAPEPSPSATTQAATTGIATPPRFPLLTVLGVLAVLLAGAGGGLLAWQMRSAGSAPPPDAATRPEDADAVEALFSLQKQEKFLEQAVKQYANPRDANEMQLGVGHCVELGVFYLEQWRIDDAGRFFSDLDKPGKAAGYRTIGKLGTAIVRGLQTNRPSRTPSFRIC